MSVFDDLLADLANSELGEDISIAHAGGVTAVRGVVSRNDQLLVEGLGTGVQAASLILEIPAAAVPVVGEGDLVTIGTQTFEVATVTAPDPVRAAWRLGLA